MPEFNQRMYETSLDVLLSASVPQDIAEAASKIVASDDATQPDLGRTAEDQVVVQEVVKILNRGVER
ncbi:hypothetical protein WDZ92_11160 [Nostoc sp. NIES-2111]